MGLFKRLLKPTLIIWWAIVLLQASIQAAQGQDTNTIRGRVIDKAGRPVARALVTLHPTRPPKRSTGATVDGLIESYETDAYGRFSIPSSPGMLQAVTLYVTTPVPPKAYAPLSAPFKDLTGASLIPGHDIVVNKNGDTDVGDVPVIVQYGTAILYLQDLAGSPLFGAYDNRLPIRLRVRNAHRDVVSEGYVPSSGIHDDTSSIALALPEGGWNIEVAVVKRNVEWYALPETLNIRPGRDLRITLRVPAFKTAPCTDPKR